MAVPWNQITFRKGVERMTTVISPWVFYAIYVANGVALLATIIAIIVGIAYAVVKATSLFEDYYGEDDEEYIKIRRISKTLGTVALVAAILATFVPGEKTITKMIVAQNVTYERVEAATDVVQTVYEDIMDLFKGEESE